MAFDPVSNSFVKEEWLDNVELQCKIEKEEEKHPSTVVTPKRGSYDDVKNVIFSTFEDKNEKFVQMDDEVTNVIISTFEDNDEKYLQTNDDFKNVDFNPFKNIGGKYVKTGDDALIISALENRVEQHVPTVSELEAHTVSVQVQCKPITLPQSKNKSNTSKRQCNRKKNKDTKMANGRPKASKCVYCDVTTNNAKDMDDHLKKNHYWCKLCRQYFDSSKVQSSHLSQYHNKLSRDVILLRRINNQMKSMSAKYCNLCGRAWSKEELLKRHRIRDHNVVYPKEVPFVTGNGIVANVKF